MSDLMAMSVGELAAHVRGGELRAREVVTAALERIEERDGRINAFMEVDADGALAAADRIEPGDERPFAGVPIAIKANTPVAGLPMNFGSKFLDDHRPGHSAYLVRRLQEAGFVIVGITNMPEFGILPTTEPRYTGPTRNPWDTTRTPGGSSGGAAAAVAGGMLPVAHGNDGGGSLRIPAACCGLVGLKPSRGRVSRGPDLGDAFLASDGVLTRTVGETPALPGKDTLRLFTGAFGPAIALQQSYGELLAGRPPEEDEIEPLSRAISDLARGMSAVEYLACVAQLQALARGVVAFFAEYDV